MIARAALAVSFALGASSCLPVQKISWPEDATENDRFILLGEGDQRRLFAFRAGEDTELAYSVPREPTVISVLVCSPGVLDAWLIETGEVPIWLEDRQGRPLPDGVVFEAEVGEGKSGEMVRLPERSRRIREVELEPLDLGRCAALGGCFEPALQPTQCRKDCMIEAWTRDEPVIEDPAPPAFPSFGDPCPPGWSEMEIASEGSIAGCAPLGMRPACTEVQSTTFFGSDACVELGDRCPSGQYATNLPPGTIYVDAATGDLQTAVETAPIGGTIALSKGTHPPVTISRAVTLVGACAAETVIQGDGNPDHTTVLSIADARVSNVTLRGGRSGFGASVGSLELDNVRVESTGRYGIIATAAAAMVRLTNVHVRGSELGVYSQRPIDAEQVTIEGTKVRGLWIELAASTSTLSRVIIRDTTSYGAVFDRAPVVAEDLLIERAGDVGLTIAGSDVTLRKLAIVDTQGSAITGAGGQALIADEGGKVVLDRALFLDTPHAALVNRGVDMIGTDVHIRRVHLNDDHGEAVVVGAKTAAFDRLLIERADAGGIILSRRPEEPPPISTFTDVAIFDTSGRTNAPARTIRAYEGSLTVKRGLFRRSSYEAVVVHHQASATLEDIEVSGIVPSEEDRPPSNGLSFECTTATLDRARIEDVTCYGINVRTTEVDPCTFATARFTDLTIRRSRACLVSLDTGAIRVIGVVDLEVDDLLIEDADEAGLFARDDATAAATIRRAIIRRTATGIDTSDLRSFSLESVVIDEHRDRGFQCKEGATIFGTNVSIARAIDGAKSGIDAHTACNIALTNFEIDTAGVTGIDLEPGFDLPRRGSLTLINGEIRHHTTGISVLGVLPDLVLQLDRVRLDQNDNSIVIEQ